MRTLILLLLAVCLSGCAAHGPINSFAGPLPEKSAVAAIADDAATILAGLYPPGHTALRVLAARDAENGFAVAFESSLRARGFTLAAPDSDALALSYTLDVLEQKTAWYLHLRLSYPNGGGRVIARCYLANGMPEGGQSQALFEARSSLPDFREVVRFEP